jgi:hypothetical protein
VKTVEKQAPRGQWSRHLCLSIVGVSTIINPIHPGGLNFARSWLVLIRPVTLTPRSFSCESERPRMG